MKKVHFGRYQSDETEIGSRIVVEDNSNHHNNDFWLAVNDSHNKPIGHLHFKKISSSSFELDRLRPAFCPIHNLSGVCTNSLSPQTEET